jgi:hypothetical protein
MKYGNVLKSRLDSGSSLEEGLTHLRMMGASPIEVMRALFETKSVNLGEARSILGKSEAWKGMTGNARRLLSSGLRRNNSGGNP